MIDPSTPVHASAPGNDDDDDLAILCATEILDPKDSMLVLVLLWTAVTNVASGDISRAKRTTDLLTAALATFPDDATVGATDNEYTTRLLAWAKDIPRP